MKKTLAALSTLLLSSAAFGAGAPVQQSGNVSPSHLTKWATSGIVADAGTSQVPGVSTLGILSQNQCSFSINTGLSPAPNTQLCFGVVPGQYAQLTLNSYGGASNVPLQFSINGTIYTFPFTIGGIVGPATSVIGDVACWNNTVGSLLYDCGALPVINTGLAGELAYYATNSAAISPLAAVDNTVLTSGATGVAAWTSYLTLPNSPTLSTSPIGNPTGGTLLATYSTVAVQGTTSNASNREYLVNFGLTSSLGNGVANNNGDKVTLYLGAVGNAGTGNLWAFNPLLAQNAGSGNYDAQVIEVDENNFDVDKGGSDGAAGLPTYTAYGVSISGAGDSNNYTNTAGLNIDSFGGASGNQPLWAHGIIVNGFYKYNEFAEYSQAPTVFAFFGGHTLGIDMSAAVIGGAGIKLASNPTGGIAVEDAAASGLERVIRGDGTNVYMCDANCSGVFSGGPITPSTNLTYALGGPSAQWANVYSGGFISSGNLVVGGTATITGATTHTGTVNFNGAAVLNSTIQLTAPSGGAAAKYVCVDASGFIIVQVGAC